MFIYNLQAIAKKLKIDYEEVTAKINHNGEKGTAREDILKEYLKDFLPLKFSVSKGIIVDINEKQSHQQDFIIYDNFESPSMMTTQSVQILPIESVYCTIEVKSKLTKKELATCVNNIKSVRSLEKNCLKNADDKYSNKNNTIGFVFAYSSNLKIETIYTELIKLNENVSPENQISGICILDKGLILNVSKAGLNTVVLYPSSESVLIYSKSELENNLYLFYLLLLHHLNYTKLLPPDLIKYAEKNNAFNISAQMFTRFFPDDGKLNISKSISFSGKDIKVITAQQPRLTKILSGLASKKELIEYVSYDLTEYMNINIKSGFIRKEVGIIDFFGTPLEYNHFKNIKFLNEKMKVSSLNEMEKKYYDNITDVMYTSYTKAYSKNTN